jgi:hypothetical protein
LSLIVIPTSGANVTPVVIMGKGTMVCSQIALPSKTWVAEISPNDPRISVAPFSTSRQRMRAEVLELTL